MTDLAVLGKILGDKIKELLAPLRERVEALEKRAPEPGAKGEKGDPGASVTLEQLQELIDKNVEKLRGRQGERGADGKDGASVKGERGADGASVTAEQLQELIEKNVEKLRGRQGERGPPGESVSIERVVELIKAHLLANVELFRGARGKDGESVKGDKGDRGERGADGKSVSMQELAAAIEAYFAANVALYRGERGERGADGADGKDGKDGASIKGDKGDRGESGADGKSVSMEEVAATIRGHLAANAALYRGERGADGKDGASIKGDKGDRGESVKGDRGERGADGKSIAIEDLTVWLEAAFSKWALDVERRIVAMAERAIERMPKPVDGKNGIGVADFAFDSENCTLSAKTADDKVIVLKLPVPQYRGIWREGPHEKGHIVTLAGSMWIALRDAAATDKPGTSDAWQQCVKKGRDGRDGK